MFRSMILRWKTLCNQDDKLNITNFLVRMAGFLEAFCFVQTYVYGKFPSAYFTIIIKAEGLVQILNLIASTSCTTATS